ncbi:MAG: flagellar protein export ATPase FliI [Proteobacteria bacterium]|nr:flagellar protein export ATPase FliI [Pseudomonadota bacterium]
MNHLNIIQSIERIQDIRLYGKVTALRSLLIEVTASNPHLSLGTQCEIHLSSPFDNQKTSSLMGEVVGFREKTALVMPLGHLDGVKPGTRVTFYPTPVITYPDKSWTGRIINALAQPIDNKGFLLQGEKGFFVRSSPPQANQRMKVGSILDVGIRSINTFLTCCMGQRMGIFSGSGIGKSILMSMLARFTECDICIIGLVGERGREVREFIEETLGEEGLAKSIVIVATSDEPPLMRRQAAYLTLTIAEYFRDLGYSVLCLIDSITRFAMAQREIGLSVGEPPTTEGYTPSVFTELAKILERAGPGLEEKGGYITAFFSVLVEGDDHNEPIADAVRGILDGHIILERAIAERGQFPAINILKSVSRTLPSCQTDYQNNIVKKARKLLAVYEDMADMIRLGAYQIGSNEEVDSAIQKYPYLVDFLSQHYQEQTSFVTSFSQLDSIVE